MAVGGNSLLRNVRIRSLQAPYQHIDVHWLGNPDLNSLMTRLVEPGRGHQPDAQATPPRRSLKQAEIAHERHLKIAEGEIKPCVVQDLFRFQKTGGRKNTDSKALHDSSCHIKRHLFRKQEQCGEDVPWREMPVTAGRNSTR